MMSLENKNADKFLSFIFKSKFFTYILPFLSFIFIEISLYMSFIYAPDEKVMGAVQRIFYFHVGSALVTYLMLALLLVGSVMYLSTKEKLWDSLASSASLIALTFASIVLLTGMIWGHSAWNVWWRWEPRLLSFLILWLFLFSYIAFKEISGSSRLQRNSAAIVGILSALQVPIVIFSVRLLPEAEQLHPQVSDNAGLKDPRYYQTLLFTSISLIIFSVWLLKLRFSQLLLEDKIEELDF